MATSKILEFETYKEAKKKLAKALTNAAEALDTLDGAAAEASRSLDAWRGLNLRVSTEAKKRGFKKAEYEFGDDWLLRSKKGLNQLKTLRRHVFRALGDLKSQVDLPFLP